jgi:hypothetical protein
VGKNAVARIGVEGPLLFEAILRRSGALVTLLLDHGVDLEAPWCLCMGTPLMWAAFLGDRAMVELLLERGAKPDAFYDGDTPVSVAESRGHHELGELLRRRALGARPSGL